MKAITLLICFLLGYNLDGQNIKESHWILSINSGIQAHDKRLYNFSGSNNLLETQPEFFGTYQLGISYSRMIATKDKYKFSCGFGLSSELSTFTRPYDHNYKKSFGNDALRYTDRYYKFLFSSPIKISNNHPGKIGFVLELLPQFSFLTIANNSTNDYNEKHSWFEINFYSIELYPGVVINLGKHELEIKYRLIQLKRIDPIIFNDLIDDPRNNTLEFYNPFKIYISINF